MSTWKFIFWRSLFMTFYYGLIKNINQKISGKLWPVQIYHNFYTPNPHLIEFWFYLGLKDAEKLTSNWRKTCLWRQNWWRQKSYICNITTL